MTARRVTTLCLLLALALTGCPGRKAPRVLRSPSPSPVPHGGTLVVAYPHEPATLNPYVRGGDAPPTRDLVRPLFPSLYRIGPGGVRTRSLLAAEPVVTPGPPFTVSVELRADARWSDGQPITASDLHYTWKAITDRRAPVIARDGLDQIADVAVDAPTRARIVYTHPFARWRDAFWAVLPEHALRGKPIGTAFARSITVSGGPFTLASWTPGLQIVYARNPNAFAPAALDRLVVRFVPDLQTAFQLLRRGEVDALGPYEGIDVARRAALIGDATTTTDSSATWAGLWFNTRSSLLSDVRVRRALAFALDRPAMVDGLVRDGGALLDAAAQGDLPVFSGYRRALARAKQTLQDAGWTGGPIRARDGVPLSITVGTIGSDELTERVLRAMHAQAAEAGIDLNVVDLEADQLWRDWLYSTVRFQAVLLIERDPSGGALDARFDSARRAPGGQNISGVADAALDRALRAADRASDTVGPDRTQAEQRLAELVPVLPLYAVTVVVVAGPHAGGLAADASADGFLAGAERWYRRAG